MDPWKKTCIFWKNWMEQKVLEFEKEWIPVVSWRFGNSWAHLNHIDGKLNRFTDRNTWKYKWRKKNWGYETERTWWRKSYLIVRRTVPWVTLLFLCIHGHTWILGTESWTGSPRKIQWMYKWRKNLLGVRTPSRSLAFLPRVNSKEKNEGWPERNRLRVKHTMDGCIWKRKKRHFVNMCFSSYTHIKKPDISDIRHVYIYIYTYIWYRCTSTIPAILSIRFQSPPYWFRLSQSKGGSQLATLNSAPVGRHFTLSLFRGSCRFQYAMTWCHHCICVFNR